jgi:hypothetical protein
MQRTRGDLEARGLRRSKRYRRREKLGLKRELLNTVELFESEQVTGCGFSCRVGSEKRV